MSDVVGSTALWETYGEDMRAALHLHDQLVHEAMEARGGRVFKHTGDGMIAVFEEATAAAGAAIAAVGALADADWGPTGPLAIRVGVHAGDVTPRGDDYFGPPLNKLARINAAGSGGQVLMSDAVRHLLPAPTGRDLGVHQLKDLGEPVHLWQLDDDEHPPLRTLVTARHNLPRQHSEFIGREPEVKEVTGLLEKCRLVTITGVGGCGKTRLAVEVAATVAGDFDGGAWFVDLSTERTDERVEVRTLEALGVSAQQDRNAADTVGMLRQATDGRPTLLIIDNCEHLIDATAEFVDELIDGLDNVRVLATSREALSVDGERVWRIPSLTSGSVELFRARSQSSGADVPDEHAELVAEICASLDHIPLAIELAAAQTAFMSVPDLAQHLDDRFALLGGGRRARRQRQQTLATMMEWSWDLLSAAEARLLTEMSVLASPFSLETIVGVASERSRSAVMNSLRGLVAQSLVVPEPAVDRYRLLETVRLFALDRLVGSNEIRATRDRQVAWVRSRFGVDACDELGAMEMVRRVWEMFGEAAEIFAALAWADQSDDLEALRDLLYGAHWIFGIDRASDGVGWLTRLPGPQSDQEVESLRRCTAEVFPNYFCGRFEETFAAARRGSELVEQLGLEGRLRETSLGLTVPMFFEAIAYNWAGEFSQAREIIARLEAIATEIDEPTVATAADCISLDLELRENATERLAAVMRRLEATPVEAMVPTVGFVRLYYGAQLALRQGEFADALELVEQTERHAGITPEAKPQMLELECQALVGLGRYRETIDALRRPAPPMLDYQRDIRRAGAALTLAVLFEALGDAAHAAQWADWCRKLSNPMVWLFRRPVLARIGDGNIGDPDGTVDPTSRIEFDNALAAALDALDELLDKG